MARQTSGFGSRPSPTPGASTNHGGVDYSTPVGSPIYARTDMTVNKAGVGSGYGNVVYATDKNGTQYRYGHLDGFPPGMKAGDTIKAGDVIGYTGNTGVSSGAHLHYEARPNGGAPVDPNGIDPKTGKPYTAAASFDPDGGNLDNTTPKPTKNRTPNSPTPPGPQPGKPTPTPTPNKPGPGSGGGRPPGQSRPPINPNAVGILINPRHKSHDGR